MDIQRCSGIEGRGAEFVLYSIGVRAATLLGLWRAYNGVEGKPGSHLFVNPIQLVDLRLRIKRISSHLLDHTQQEVQGSVFNSPGRLPGARDRTGRQNAVHSRPGNLRTAVIAKDGGPCNVRN